MPELLATFRGWARALKRHVLVVYCIGRDVRTPMAVKVLAVFIAAYALSPIDLIPDFIPVLGLLDDLVIVPLGIWLVLRRVPEAVLHDARAAADVMGERPVSRVMAVFVVACWALLTVAGIVWAKRAWAA